MKMNRTLSTLPWISAACVVSVLLLGGSHAAGAPASAGQDLFKAKCAMCHGADGSGRTPMGERLKIPDLRSHDVQKHTDDQLASVIRDGDPPMPAYKALSSAEIHQLIVYIRSLAGKS